jgi:serine/threonine protein kinase
MNDLAFQPFDRYAENGDVDNFLRTRGYLSENHARTWMRQVVTALDYLHDGGIAHRDLKCSNLLITDKFNIKMADFGFSRFSTDHYGKRVLSETWCGSPAFTAPEIVVGAAYDPFLADCWALGVVMYAMLTASLPFDGTMHPKKLYQHQVRLHTPRSDYGHERVEFPLFARFVTITNSVSPFSLIAFRWRLKDANGWKIHSTVPNRGFMAASRIQTRISTEFHALVTGRRHLYPIGSKLYVNTRKSVSIIAGTGIASLLIGAHKLIK